MQILILRSYNKEALEALKTLADALDIESSLKPNQGRKIIKLRKE